MGWKGETFKFRINGVAYSDYAKDPTMCRMLSGCATLLEGAPITVKSVMQKIVTLSVTEAETVAGFQFAQDMLYII